MRTALRRIDIDARRRARTHRCLKRNGKIEMAKKRAESLSARLTILEKPKIIILYGNFENTLPDFSGDLQLFQYNRFKLFGHFWRYASVDFEVEGDGDVTAPCCRGGLFEQFFQLRTLARKIYRLGEHRKYDFAVLLESPRGEYERIFQRGVCRGAGQIGG